MDIFDMKSIDDIPKEISKDLKQVKFGGLPSFSIRIVNLFKMAERPLSIDEVTVSYYRLYKEERSKKQIMSKLYNMTKEVLLPYELVSVYRGTYDLKVKNESPRKK